MIEYNKWVHSNYEEAYHPVEYFESKEECIKDGEIEYGGESFWVGRTTKPVLAIPHFLPENVLESIYEYADDQTGEFCEGWYDKFPLEKLEQYLIEAWDKVLLDHPIDWFMIENSECISPEPRTETNEENDE